MTLIASENVNMELNLELEDLRNAALNSIPNNKDLLDDLTQITKVLHAAWLFHPWGKPALVSLCESLSSVSANKSGSWYDVAGMLKIPFGKRECILNDLSGWDKSELSLRTYAQYSNSTLHEIITVLDEVKRYDALVKVQPLIKNLVETIKSHVGQQRWESLNQSNNENVADQPDSGYDSLPGINSTTQSVERYTIIRPKGYNKLKLNMPITLQISPTDDINLSSGEIQIITKKKDAIKTAVKKDVIYERSVLTTATITDSEGPSRNIKESEPVPYKKTVFLTFASDGEDAAYRIASILRHPKSKRAPFGVLILDENAEKINRNPEAVIGTLFNQVDYVMPIITKGYLESLKLNSTSVSIGDMASSIDSRYTYYIHDLMRQYYVKNFCRNDKFRCVIANVDKDNSANIQSIVNNQIFSSEPTLRAWMYEIDLEKMAQRLINS